MKSFVFIVLFFSSIAGQCQELSLKNMIVMLPVADFEELREYWVDISSTQKDCNKIIAFRTSDIFPDSVESDINAHENCVMIMDNPTLFFYIVEKYLELDGFKLKKNKGKLMLHLVETATTSEVKKKTHLRVKFKVSKYRGVMYRARVMR